MKMIPLLLSFAFVGVSAHAAAPGRGRGVAVQVAHQDLRIDEGNKRVVCKRDRWAPARDCDEINRMAIPLSVPPELWETMLDGTMRSSHTVVSTAPFATAELKDGNGMTWTLSAFYKLGVSEPRRLHPLPLQRQLIQPAGYILQPQFFGFIIVEGKAHPVASQQEFEDRAIRPLYTDKTKAKVEKVLGERP